MKAVWVLSVALASVSLAGCALKPMDYRSGDHMAKAKGLLVHNSPSATDSGLVLYSDNPKQPSIFGPKAAQKAKKPAKARPASVTRSAAQPAVRPANYAQFQAFEAYQRFERLSKNSPQYRRFQQWLRWQHYQQWQAQRKSH